jgi:hypothetical protein
VFPPLVQGDGDGLCGIYAAINAVDPLIGSVLSEDSAQASRLISWLIQMFPSREFHGAFLQGLRTDQMKSVLSLVSTYVLNTYSLKIRVSQPWARSTRRLLEFDDFWDDLSFRLTDPNTSAVIGLSKPPHWTACVDADSNTLHLRDSDGMLDIPFASCGYKQDNTEYAIAPRTCFILRLTTP